MTVDLHKKLTPLYNNYYKDIFKPLLAEVEAKFELLPAAILNEIRAFNDHVSRCYWHGSTDKDIDENILKAKGHLKRAILDCFKYINVYYYEEIEKIEKKYSRGDLTAIDQGSFFIEYTKKKQLTLSLIHEAKKNETTDFDKAFDKFQEAYNEYSAFYDFIITNLSKMYWAKVKYYKDRLFFRALPWAIALVLGFFSLQDIKQGFLFVYKKGQFLYSSSLHLINLHTK